MDLRTERTKRSIANAFLELRKQKNIEKITVKELAELAYINKATFYIHYRDIYDLADEVEIEVVREILGQMKYKDKLLTHPELFVKESMQVFEQNTENIK